MSVLCYSLYFANSGLNTQLNLLNTGQAWWTLVVLILLASVSKIVPVTLVSKLCSKKPWFYCLSIGVLMNTRGIVQLVVLNIGVQLGVLSPKLFAIFVLMATILTFLTSPILSVLYRKNYDIHKLSVPNVAAQLRESRDRNMNDMVTDEDKEEEEKRGDGDGDEDNNNTIVTISNGDMFSIGSKQSSTQSQRKFPTPFGINGGATVTFDDQINYVDFNSNPSGPGGTTIQRILSTSSHLPRRSISMTRF